MAYSDRTSTGTGLGPGLIYTCTNIFAIRLIPVPGPGPGPVKALSVLSHYTESCNRGTVNSVFGK